LHQLQDLLKELPSLVSDFVQHQGGANATLPPILRTPTEFSMKDDDGDCCGGCCDDKEDTKLQEIDDQDDGNDEIIDGNNNDTCDIDDCNGGEYCDNKDPGDIEEFLGVDVLLDASTFTPPPEFACSPLAPLVRNPLAWIQPVATIVKHYKHEWENQSQDLYLLNVNYAGNEMHEPSIRVLIRDEESPESIDLQEEPPSPRLQCYVHIGLYCPKGE